MYTSFSAGGVVREVSPMGRRMQPLVLCAYAVDVKPVFDALNPEVRKSQSVNDGELDCPDWRLEMYAGRTPASQALAERLISAGFAGMRVGSYAAGASDDCNLVLWRWDDHLPCKVDLIDDDRRLAAVRPAKSTTGS